MADHTPLYEQVGWLLRPGKGILAADESVSTMNKRLAAISVDGTDEIRRVYRELLFTAPKIEQYLSGVILYDETLRSGLADGTPFSDVLAARGIIAGIKVDQGLVDVPEFPGEQVTQGLDNLGARAEEYVDLGAYFTKWRSVVPISAATPSDALIAQNAVIMARYASIAQAAGLVPIIEPEVLMSGDHDIGRAEEVTTRALQITFATMREYKIDLKAVILKTSMVLAGDTYKTPTSPDEVADATIRALRLSVPYEVPGVVFLSGGQTPKRATENLQALCSRGEQPWKLTFSYSRAIEEPVLAAWKGDKENTEEAQAVLLHRLRMNALALAGQYTPEKERELRV